MKLVVVLAHAARAYAIGNIPINKTITEIEDQKNEHNSAETTHEFPEKWCWFVRHDGFTGLTEWLTCRRDTQDAKTIIMGNFAAFAPHTDAEGGQVQPVLGGVLGDLSPITNLPVYSFITGASAFSETRFEL